MVLSLAINDAIFIGEDLGVPRFLQDLGLKWRISERVDGQPVPVKAEIRVQVGLQVLPVDHPFGQPLVVPPFKSSRILLWMAHMRSARATSSTVFLETTVGLWASDPTYEREPKCIMLAYHLLSFFEPSESLP